KENKNSKEKYPYAEWERKRELVKDRLKKLPEYIEKASSMITVQKKRGPDKELDLVQRTTLFLFAKLMRKSNMDMEEILILLKPLFNISISYKIIERLYSDDEVRMALHNLFVLLLEDEGVSGNISGDGMFIRQGKVRRNNPPKKGRHAEHGYACSRLFA
ncbi:MAG: hypothetical protein GXO64_05180, partial [Candidatus Micrarchaeota archaeon]|nr:hypothetical protein [Candidatus Micrarchaeota archaeon]